jgi:hypothetical protein
MIFLDAAAFSIAPVLVAVLAATLILPRAWLATYAVFVIAAAVICADYSDRYDDAAFGDIFSALFSMLVVAALLAGLAIRWALKWRPRQTD